MARRRSEQVLITRTDPSGIRRVADHVAVEEPLEIRLDGELVTTTMRTPGHDFELAVGFCHAEGLLDGVTVRTVRYCATGSAVETAFNVVTVDTGGAAPTPTARVMPTTSSCGLCGSVSLAALADRLGPLPPAPPPDLRVLYGVPERMRAEQELFGRTGAVHAAAAFDTAGEPVVVREDVGRHNAVDKVVGRLVLDGVSAPERRRLGLYVSGRASFEIVQKAWAAGFASIVAVSAPTSLAVETARAAGIVLVGFVRDGTGNVYAPERWAADG